MAAERSPRDVRELLDQGQALVVDVREPHEREAGRIDGTEHIPLGRLTEEAERLPKEQPIVFYCRVGSRSAMAVDAFRAAGYDAYNLEGGIVKWVADGLAIEGEIAEH